MLIYLLTLDKKYNIISYPRKIINEFCELTAEESYLLHGLHKVYILNPKTPLHNSKTP